MDKGIEFMIIDTAGCKTREEAKKMLCQQLHKLSQEGWELVSVEFSPSSNNIFFQALLEKDPLMTILEIK